jgi:hypothetical protein
MTKSEASQWVTAATNAAVLIGVVILVIELRQNAELAQLQMIQDRTSAFQQAEQAFFDPRLSRIWVKSFKEPGSMTLEEIRAMDAYLTINVTQLWRYYGLEQAGLLDRGQTLELIEGDLPFLLGSRFAKIWWELEGQNTWQPEFIELVRPVADSVDVNGLNERFDRLQSALGAE